MTAPGLATQRRYALFWLGVFAFLLLALYLLSSILLPFVAGAAIAYFLNPAVDRLVGWAVPRGLAAGAVLLLFIAGLVLLLMLLVPLLQVQAVELARRAPALVEFGRAQIQRLTEFAQQTLTPEDLARVREMAGSWAGAALGWAARILQEVLTSGIALANVLSLVFITPIVAFFLLRDWGRLVRRIDGWLPRHQAATIREQAHLIDRTLAGFVHGQFLVGLILAVYYSIALTIAGVNFAVIIAILIGVLSFIPYLGVALGLLLALGSGLAQFGLSPILLVILGIFAAGHAVESNFLSPKLVGKRVNLHPVWVIFALLAFGTLFGILGLLLALPAAAVTGVLVRFALGRYLASPLYDPDTRRPEGLG